MKQTPTKSEHYLKVCPMIVKKLNAQLEKQIELHGKGEVPMLLQWAALHIGDCALTIAEQHGQISALTLENFAMREQLKRIDDGMFDLRKIVSLPTDGLSTVAIDHSSHINVMAAHGVEPYTKRVKGWQDKQAKKSKNPRTSEIPALEFALGGAA